MISGRLNDWSYISWYCHLKRHSVFTREGSRLTSSSNVKGIVVVFVTDLVTVPVNVVVVGVGHSRTDEQNLDIDNVRAKEALIESAQLWTLATAVHDGSSAKLAEGFETRQTSAANHSLTRLPFIVDINPSQTLSSPVYESERGNRDSKKDDNQLNEKTNSTSGGRASSH
jgi:hypothetical protein